MLQEAERPYLVADSKGQNERRIAVNDSVVKTIGLIGAGHIGSQIARLAVRNNYNVVISNSRGPGTLSPLVAELGPRARAATAADAAKAGDIVVVTVPLKNYRAFRSRRLQARSSSAPATLHWRDGHIAELDNSRRPPNARGAPAERRSSDSTISTPLRSL
jgi:hypothetical protein